jgi:hypothetical protein
MRALAVTPLLALLAVPAGAEISSSISALEQVANPSTLIFGSPLCLDRGALVGGGFDTLDDDILTGFTSEPRSDLEGWRAAMRNDGAAAGQVSVASICDDAVAPGTVVVEPFTVPGDTVASDFVLCPEGTIATSGGVSATGTPGVSSAMLSVPMFPFDPGGARLRERADGEAPAPSAWEAVHFGEEDGITVTATVSALCVERENVVTIVESDTVAPGATESEIVLCPGGMAAVGGGVDAADRSGLRLVANGPVFFGFPVPARLALLGTGDAGAPVGWIVALRSDAATSRAFKAAAICAPEPASAVLGVAAIGAIAAVSRARR